MSETNQNDHTGIFRPAEGDTQIDLLMRHSSPYTRDGAPPSPMTLERNNNGSPSPLRLNRPRSNPRNRTPMRYASPTTAAALQGGGGGGGDNNDAAAAFRRIPEHGPVATRGITILPTAGRAVGTALAAGRIGFRQTAGGTANERPILATRSRKQGPSHRKIRRWNNDNFVNLAAEIQSGNKKGGRAAQALLLGQADAARYQSILGDPEDHECKAMKQFREDDRLQLVREQFFAGELNAKPAEAPHSRSLTNMTESATPEDMMLRMEARLRRVVVRACENSVPASSVVEHVEAFLVRAHRGKSVPDTSWWQGLLLEPPTTTHRKQDNVYITRFLFDGNDPNGGFHRLLLHGLCQFHGLRASSSTMELAVEQKGSSETTMTMTKMQQARLLVATGTIAEVHKKVKMVEYIMLRKELKEGSNDSHNIGVTKETKLEKATNALQALKV